MFGGGVGIDAEIAHALELAPVSGGLGGDGGFDEALEDFHGVGVEAGFEVAIFGGHGVFEGEEFVDHAEFGGDGVGGAQPVDGDFDLAAVGGFSAQAFGVVGASHLEDVAVLVLVDADAFEEIGVAQAHFAARGEAEEFFGGVFHEIGAVDPELAGEGEFSGTHGLVGGVPWGVEPFDLAFGVIFDDDLEGLGDAHDARGDVVEALADAVFEEGDVDHRIAFVDADAFTEGADGFWGETATAHAGDRRHTRIVPARHDAVAHEAEQAALAHHGVRKVEFGKLDLLGVTVEFEGIDEPVVKDAVILKFQGAHGMRDALDGVGQAVGEVVHGIDAPFVAGAVVDDVFDAIDQGIAHVHILMIHVDLCSQHAFAFLELAVFHALEEVEAFLGRAVAPGARFSGGVEVSAVFADLLRRELAHVSLAATDEFLGPFVELVKIVGGKVEVVPVEPEPFDVLFDRIAVLGVFFDGIGVVEPQVAGAPERLGESEVQTDGFGMANVEIPVGLGRKARGHAPAVLAVAEIFLYNFADKIRTNLDF